MRIIGSSNRNFNCKILSAPISLYKAIVLRSFAYRKLPHQMLSLSILKLDGHCFSVNVSKNATVGDVKRAVEEIFKFSSELEGHILWSLVWRHFCLCYEGQKLINDKACIGSYGIKDGDQLQFIRHMVIDQKPVVKQSGNCKTDAKNSIIICRSTSRHATKDDEIFIEHEEMNLKFHHNCEERDGPYPYKNEFKLARDLKGRWVSYSRLWGYTRKILQRSEASPSMFSLQYPAVGSEDSVCMLTVE